MGACEAGAPASVEAPVKYHPCLVGALTRGVDLRGQCQVGSFTGAVASIVGRPDGDIRGKSGCMLGSPSSNMFVASRTYEGV